MYSCSHIMAVTVMLLMMIHLGEDMKLTIMHMHFKQLGLSEI